MNVLDNLMSPLGKNHCMILYYLGLIQFFGALIVLVTGLVKLFDKKGNGGLIILNSLMMFFVYYLYRIAYSMCAKSL